MKVVLLTTDGRDLLKTYHAPAPSFGTALDALLQGFALLSEVEVHVVSCLREQAPSPPKLAPNIFFHSLCVPKIGWVRTGYQGCIRAVRKKLTEIQPDVVHGQGTERDCAITAAFSGWPNVVTVHGNMRRIAKMSRVRPFSPLWLAARLEGFTLPRSNGVVCLSSHTQRAVAKLVRRTWVVPNAVNVSFFEVNARPAEGVPARLLCVAGVAPWKNQHALIRALDPLARRHNFELRFCGGANERDAYGEEFLRLVRARPWCVYHGVAELDELKGLLSQATALVLPSLEDNCPMSVLEAMAAGVPVVASRIGGLPDLVEEGRTGYFCDPLQAPSMAAAIEKVLVDRLAAAEMGREAKRRARARFCPEVIAQRHIEIYLEIARNPSQTHSCSN